MKQGELVTRVREFIGVDAGHAGITDEQIEAYLVAAAGGPRAVITPSTAEAIVRKAAEIFAQAEKL